MSIFRNIQIFGIVQGVGFRPFVSRLADRLGILGSVANKGSFVEIFAQAETIKQMDEFLEALNNEAPPRSTILRISSREINLPEPFTSFEIIESATESGDIFVSPDIATCEQCAKELFSPGNRRYLHPFINCTACGPRLTILENMPYDRSRTTMKKFPMCKECETEYTSPESRRYDAQPVCCNECGPSLYIFNPKENSISQTRENPIITARHEIMQGRIIAIKGIGGFHLACNALDQNAVLRLRALKHRPAKPFAVMFRDISALKKYCGSSPEQEILLTGHQKPIVLLRDSGKLAPAVSPGNPFIGAFLPYTPLHMLIFDYPLDNVPMTDAIVLTSGNLSGAPICRSDEDVRKQLAGFCDLVLSHDRPILLRADDSVVDFFEDKPYMIRRSRGFAPLPVAIDNIPHNTVVGIGGELKNCFCIAKNGLFYLSPYIGDMEDMRSVEALRESLSRMGALLETTHPEAIACDMHPKYNSSMVARETALPCIEIQHHYAHILSCMAENNTISPVIGIAFDGTGFGTDGSIWGGEILLCSTTEFTRFSHIPEFAQPGGDASAKEGWRIATSILQKLGLSESIARLNLCSAQEAQVIKAMISGNINTVRSTSTGRLFDALSAMLGLRRTSSFEGEAAMALQFAALKATEHIAGSADLDFQIRSLVREKLAGRPVESLAWTFHDSLAEFAASQAIAARDVSGINTVALSGGVFQNTLLLKLTKSKLENLGFSVLIHSLVPPNDGGIALGQALHACVSLASRKNTKDNSATRRLSCV